MRIFHFILLSMLLSVAPALAHSRNFVIAFSPNQPATDAKAQTAHALQFLVTLEPGDSAILLDGFHLKTLGTFTVPAGAAYASPKARLGANRAAAGTLMNFAKNARGSSASVRLPQLLRHVAATYAAAAPVDVIVFGSPLYDDPNEPEFSMAGGLIPSDGHLKTSRAKSPFGAADNPKALANLRVHLAYGDEALMQSDRHRYFVERFWTLFTQMQGGALTTFTADRQALFARVRGAALPTAQPFTLDASTKLEMIRLRAESAAVPIYERPVTRASLPVHLWRSTGPVQIGLTWDCGACDLDLYARPRADAPVLYFGNSTSPDGTYWKDIRQSPRARSGYETIEFYGPLDLRALQVAINFYEGHAPEGVNGELRLSLEGRTYAAGFRIAATTGNGGNGIASALQSGRAPSPQVVLIDPLTVIAARTGE